MNLYLELPPVLRVLGGNDAASQSLANTLTARAASFEAAVATLIRRNFTRISRISSFRIE